MKGTKGVREVGELRHPLLVAADVNDVAMVEHPIDQGVGQDQDLPDPGGPQEDHVSMRSTKPRSWSDSICLGLDRSGTTGGPGSYAVLANVGREDASPSWRSCVPAGDSMGRCG